MNSDPAKSILVIDDEPRIRDLVSHWLERAGYRVICADCGAQAARMLQVERFDLVITDIVMPDGDGFEVIAMLKKLQPDARILAISGGGQYLQSADCLKMARGLGAHAAVVKPFNWEQLQAGIALAYPDAAAEQPRGGR